MPVVEHAYFPAKLPATPPTGFVRLYFGAEFCCWQMPSAAQLQAAVKWCRDAGWPLTLVTPVLAEPERLRLQQILEDVLPLLEQGDEVVISDWGGFELVRSVRTDLPVVLGRALSGQKRGPRILDMQLSAEERAYFRRGSWYNHEAVALLQEMNINRVELDNLLQGLEPLPTVLVGTLHLPYAMVTSSRNCPFRTIGPDAPCPQPCGEVFRLQAGDTALPLLQSGNTQFLENHDVPDDLGRLGIDRLVTHPALPR